MENRRKEIARNGFLTTLVMMIIVIGLVVLLSGCGMEPEKGGITDPVHVKVLKMPYQSSQSSQSISIVWKYEDEKLLWEIRGAAFAKGILRELGTELSRNQIKNFLWALERDE